MTPEQKAEVERGREWDDRVAFAVRHAEIGLGVLIASRYDGSSAGEQLQAVSTVAAGILISEAIREGLAPQSPVTLAEIDLDALARTANPYTKPVESDSGRYPSGSGE